MELMDALSLDIYGKLQPLVLGACVVGIVDGLIYLWNNLIIHRDIKPSNFLVNSNGEVKLADFGVSKQMSQSIAWSYVGTKIYMAPERIYGEVYNMTSDIWSLGISLAEMALGRFPFEKELKTKEYLIIRQEHISNLILEKELKIIGNGFVDELINGCLMIIPKQRLNLKELTSNKFLLAHRPMNKNIVSEFIKEKQKNNNIGK
ncbi:Protein kinase domain-containing protein, partial [Meloidogyne graminicola]